MAEGTSLSTIKNFVQEFLQQSPRQTVMRQGKIDEINMDGTVDITLGGSGIIIPGVKRLTSFHPQEGETIWVAQTGPDLLIVGKVATEPPPDVLRSVEYIDNGQASDTSFFDVEVPSGEFSIIQVFVRGNVQEGSPAFISNRINNDSTSGLHRYGIVTRDSAGANLPAGTAHGNGVASSRIAHWSTVTNCSFMATYFFTDVASLVSWQVEGQRSSEFTTANTFSTANGRVNSTRLLTSIRFLANAATGQSGIEFDTVRWWMMGLRAN